MKGSDLALSWSTDEEQAIHASMQMDPDPYQVCSMNSFSKGD